MSASEGQGVRSLDGQHGSDGTTAAPTTDREAEQSGPIWLARIALGLVGLGFAGWGLVSLVMHVPLPQLWPVVRWGIGAILVHDALLAPIGVVAGWLIIRHVNARTRPVLRAGLLGAAAVALLVAASIGGRQRRQNPTVLTTDPLVSIGVAAVTLAFGMIIAALLHRDRHRR